MRRTVFFLALICCAAALSSCASGGTALTDAEAAAITEICGIEASLFEDVSADAITKERGAKFPAVAKAYRNEGLYAFIVKPVGYNGPITMAVAIDAKSGGTVGIKILSHAETPHYVRDMESGWFTERFAGKSADEPLTTVRLAAYASREIVAITGATVTTEAIVNGVNAALGLYREYALGVASEAVPLEVRFEPGVGDGPVETGSVAIRAYGLALGQISIDDIRALPSALRALNIHSASGTTLHNFRGTLLSNVLELVDAGIMDEFGAVTAVGVDGYSSVISMEEVKAENNVYIMYEDNGEPLPRKNGQPGAMRIVVIDDVFGQRFTNYLLEIVLERD